MLHQKEKKNPQWCERQKDKELFFFKTSILNPKQTHVMSYALICKQKKTKIDFQTFGLNNNETTHIHQEININQGHFNYCSKHPPSSHGAKTCLNTSTQMINWLQQKSNFLHSSASLMTLCQQLRWALPLRNRPMKLEDDEKTTHD